jgi:predicted HD phosphohydrolase
MLPTSRTGPDLTLDTIADWLHRRAAGMVGGEAVTQLEHALQCATLAQEDDATPAMVTAALLHDIGHLVQGAPNQDSSVGNIPCDHA